MDRVASQRPNIPYNQRSLGDIRPKLSSNEKTCSAAALVIKWLDEATGCLFPFSEYYKAGLDFSF